MQNNLKIMITGASRGIGKAIAKKVSKRADKLFIISKNNTTLNKTVKEIETFFNGEIKYTNIDQADAKKSSVVLGKWVKNSTDYLDAIILCAGNFTEGKLQEINNDDFMKNLNTNFLFNYFIVNELIPLLKKSKYPKIIIIGSTAAYNSYSVPTYSVAKWALRGYAKNLREELKNEGIGVTFISPGPTLTDMWADVELPKDRLLDPNDIAIIVDELFELSRQAVVEELIINPMLGDIDE